MTKQEVAKLPEHVKGFMRVGKPWSTAPEGWREVAKGVHLGGGQWILRYERITEEKEQCHP